MKTRELLGCCFKGFVLAKLVSCSTEGVLHAMKGNSLERKVEPDIPSGLTSNSRWAGLPSQVNFTVEIDKFGDKLEHGLGVNYKSLRF